MVECLAWDQMVASSRLTGGTVSANDNIGIKNCPACKEIKASASYLYNET